MKLYNTMYRFIVDILSWVVGFRPLYVDQFQFHQYWASFVHNIYKMCPATILQSFMQHITCSTCTSCACKKKYGYNLIWQNKAFTYRESVYL